ncbi:MAG: YgiQ family radical SAM protein, partial [Halioglobus sp.]|nr:YgiQ family radical SAM protein [Halioglobus sp.]
MSRAEMDALGWDSCDVIIVTGDAYVDHPSFGMAVIGRLLEAQGFRVGIIAQPQWDSAEPFKVLGRPNLFFGVAAGNMDSMINRYTADRKRRNDDAYTPGNEGDKRPDRAVIVYSQRLREAYRDVPLVIGGIEASLRRIAHYDYWSDKVRRSILLDSRADLLLYGNAERAIVDIAHRLAGGEPIHTVRDLRGTAFVRKRIPAGWEAIDSTSIDIVGPISAPVNPYIDTGSASCATTVAGAALVAAEPVTLVGAAGGAAQTVLRIPAYEQVKSDSALYAHASRILHKETNPYNARPLVQAHGDREVWLNAPPIPLETDELDAV